MIKGLIYLTGVVTLLIITVTLAIAFRLDLLPWGEYIEDGRELIVEQLDSVKLDSIRNNQPAAPQEPTYKQPEPKTVYVPVPIEASTNYERTTSRPEKKICRHAVSHGDTLYALAREYYGDPTQWRLIARANAIAKSADLKVGRVIVIPKRTSRFAQKSDPAYPDLRLALSPALRLSSQDNNREQTE